MDRLSRRDMRIMAATLHAEAASEPASGVLAVAQVIFNRAGNPRSLWQAGADAHTGAIEATCFAPYQFSCWNGDRRLALLKYFVQGNPDKGWLSPKTARRERDLLRAYIDGRETAPPEVDGCSHYVNPDKASPRWGGNVDKGHRIGRHVFLRPNQLTPREKTVRPVYPRPVGAERTPRLSPRQTIGVVGTITAAIGGVLEWAGDIIDRLWSIGVSTDDIAKGLSQIDPRYLFVLALIGAAVFLLYPRKDKTHETGHSETPTGTNPYHREWLNEGHDHKRGDSGRGAVRSAGHRKQARIAQDGIDAALLGKLFNG